MVPQPAESETATGLAAPQPVKVGLGMSNAVVFILMLGVVGALAVTGIYTGATSTGSARVFGIGFGALFAIPLVMLIIGLPRMLAPRHVMFEAAGVSILHGKRKVTVPWNDLVAVGIGYEEAPAKEWKTPLTPNQLQDLAKDHAVGKVQELLQLEGKRRYALEIYPARRTATEDYKLLKPYWKEQAPPAQGLPDVLWRFPLPPVDSIALKIGGGAQAVAPRHWLGWVPRPWSG